MHTAPIKLPGMWVFSNFLLVLGGNYTLGSVVCLLYLADLKVTQLEYGVLEIEVSMIKFFLE